MPAELHEAAEAGDVAALTALLEGGADPTLRHAALGFRVAYDLCKTREARNAFRKEMGRSPEAWTGGGACPDALSEEAEAERDERERESEEKKKKAEKARKERRRAERRRGSRRSPRSDGRRVRRR